MSVVFKRLSVRFMKKYFVRFECRSRARLESLKQLQQDKRRQLRFPSADPKVPSLVIYNLRKKDGDVFLPDGLGIDAHVESTTIDKAIIDCGFLAALVVNATTFASGAEASAPTFLLAYDASQSSGERELVCDTWLGPVFNFRLLELELFAPIVQTLFKLVPGAKGSKEDVQRFKRIDRCLKWFRKGLGENTVIDEFAAYWTALETLDSLIRRERKISLACKKCGKTVDRCNHCGEEIPPATTAVNSLDGIRFIFENVGLDNKLLNEIRRIRGGLLHGGKSLGRKNAISWSPNFLI